MLQEILTFIFIACAVIYTIVKVYPAVFTARKNVSSSSCSGCAGCSLKNKNITGCGDYQKLNKVL